MKTLPSCFAALFFLLLPASVRAQTNALTPEEEKRAALRIPDLDRSALEPGQRRPTDVKPGERNPFGLLAVPPPEEQEEQVKIEVETEEMKIRRILGNMRVTGLAGSPGDYRVVVGSMQLAEGDIVPRLFANQAEVLRVDRISDRQVLLSFVERKQQGQEDLPPRTVGLGIDLAPRVRSLLPGELFVNVIKFDEKGAQAMEPLKTEAVETIVRQFKTNGLTEALTDHRRAFLGDISPVNQDDKTEPESAE
jgi:hypothetical protein